MEKSGTEKTRRVKAARSSFQSKGLKRVAKTYWVDENHAFVLQPEVLGQECIITFELAKEALNLALFDFNHKRFRPIQLLRRYHQVTIYTNQLDFHFQEKKVKRTTNGAFLK